MFLSSIFKVYRPYVIYSTTSSLQDILLLPTLSTCSVKKERVRFPSRATPTKGADEHPVRSGVTLPHLTLNCGTKELCWELNI